MKTKVNHTTIRNEKLLCLNCGGDFKLQMPIQVDMMTGIIDTFNKLHKNCKPTWKEPEADQSKGVKEKAMWWIANGHVGMSSKTIWKNY